METGSNGTKVLEEEMYHRRRAPKHVQGTLTGSSWTTYCWRCQGSCREPDAHGWRPAAHFMREWTADPGGRRLSPIPPVLQPRSAQDYQYSTEQWERWERWQAQIGNIDIDILIVKQAFLLGEEVERMWCQT